MSAHPHLINGGPVVMVTMTYLPTVVVPNDGDVWPTGVLLFPDGHLFEVVGDEHGEDGSLITQVGHEALTQQVHVLLNPGTTPLGTKKVSDMTQ